VSAWHFDWLLHHAVARPTHPALIDLWSGRSSTYAGLHETVARLAGHLRHDRRIRKGDRIAVLAHNCSQHFEIMFACARLGAIYVPLNWRLTTPELAYILRDAEPSLLATDEACAVNAEQLQREGCIAQCLNFGGQNPVAYEQIIESAEPLREAEQLSHDDVQMLMYTSGTTGFPKGAMITFGMTFWNAVNVGIPAAISPKARLLSVMPLFHTGGLNLFANPVFHAGGTVFLMRAFEPAAMLTALGDSALAISHTFAVPTAYQAMAQHTAFAQARFDHLKRRPPYSMRGGSAASILLMATA
jgi:fatty-acyl-CoA synthase